MHRHLNPVLSKRAGPKKYHFHVIEPGCVGPAKRDSPAMLQLKYSNLR